MKLYLIWAVVFIAAVGLSIVVGNYSGGALYLYLSGMPVSDVLWGTLYKAIRVPYSHPHFTNAVWGCVLAAWVFFLPVLISVITIWMLLLPKNKSLYGDARFASNKELEAFHYKGDYN